MYEGRYGLKEVIICGLGTWHSALFMFRTNHNDYHSVGSVAEFWLYPKATLPNYGRSACYEGIGVHELGIQHECPLAWQN